MLDVGGRVERGLVDGGGEDAGRVVVGAIECGVGDDGVGGGYGRGAGERTSLWLCSTLRGF